MVLADHWLRQRTSRVEPQPDVSSYPNEYV